MTNPRKFTPEQLTAAQAMRDKGVKWYTVSLEFGPGIYSALKYTHTRWGGPCACGTINHGNRHFCTGCGVITKRGKSI